MASNPPFQVEDTDEDFFDKLVNDDDDDDDDYKVTPLASGIGTSLADENDSDDAKAFANLGISDVGAGVEDSGEVRIGEEEEDIKACSSTNGDIKDKSTGTSVDPGHPLVTSNSFAFDSVNEEPNTAATTGLEEPFSSTASWNHGSGGAPEVKEVQWSAFTTDPVESGSNGFGSYPDFFTEFGDNVVDKVGKGDNLTISEQNIVPGTGSVVGHSLPAENVNDYSHQVQAVQAYAPAGEQSTDGQDLNSSQYWENLYPGWTYDASAGQWYQVDEGYDATENVQEAYDLNTASKWTVSNEVSHLQQTVQSVVGAVAEKGTTENVTSWNPVSQANKTNESLSNWDQVSQENNGYPSYMVFDPQYPGWYFDMNTQEWRSLDSYNTEPTVQAQDHVNQNGFSATNTYYGNEQKRYGGHDQFDKQSGSEDFSRQEQDYKWNGSFSNVEQLGSTVWQPDAFAKSAPTSDLRGNQQVQNHDGTNFHFDNHVNDYGGVASSFRTSSQVANEFPAVSGAQSFVPGGNFSQPFSQFKIEHSEMMNVPKAYGNQNQPSYYQQPVQSVQQVSRASTAGRSSAGRPPHALVTFGFGGKLLVMKDSTTLMNASYGSQDSDSRSISVLNLAEVFTGGTDASSSAAGVSFPGPLAGGNVGGKELSKWIDERITYSESPNMDYGNGKVLKLLLSLLKIASQHYGKLRSPFGADATSKENDAPEVAVARLFASVRNNGAEYSDYGAFTHCLQQLPSERQTLATAAEVQTLLVSGRKIEALHCAQEGQLWGPALVLAAQLGDQFYVETVRKMALRQFVPGSPLRTLCLLIAGQPADAFSTESTTDGGVPSVVDISQQPVQAQPGANAMLEDWEENLAVIAANRTKDDELVLIHLGDCLWKERSNIMAAHICYLVAETNIEPYSDSARMCLIGADHWKHPRTYASPEAIQRTEVYEYAKLLGNSQFTLLPFQPYKLIYAHMLAEVGRVSDSLKYCQVVSKSLKTGRAPEVETWRQLASSLEDRIKAYQQGGFSTNLAPGKLVGKLLNLFDSTAHRVVGGLPPPVPSTSGGGMQNGHHHQPMGPRVSTSQSTMAMSSLVPSPSMEPMSQWSDEGNNRKMIQNRSVSEPDFGRSTRQVDPSKENSADSQNKTSGGTSRFGRFGSQLLQKTVGLVLKPRGDKQAKLGDANKFYYDEKLKRWVEEGVDPPAEEAALLPPPTIATFQNGASDYSLRSPLKSEGSQSNGGSEFTSPIPVGHGSGIPPIPATSNQFSARGRIGVRARYVDTFNQGAPNPTNLFQSPPAPTLKPAANPNPKFFVPTAAPLAEQPVDPYPDNMQQPTTDVKESHSFSLLNNSFQSPSPMTRHKFASMDDISEARTATFANDTMSPGSRRTASWSGNEQGLSFSSRGDHASMHMSTINDDLQEVDL